MSQILSKNKRIEVKYISALFSLFIWNIYLTTLIDNKRTSNPYVTLLKNVFISVVYKIKRIRTAPHQKQKNTTCQNIQNKLQILTTEVHNGDWTINKFLLTKCHVIRYLKYSYTKYTVYYFF